MGFIRRPGKWYGLMPRIPPQWTFRRQMVPAVAFKAAITNSGALIDRHLFLRFYVSPRPHPPSFFRPPPSPCGAPSKVQNRSLLPRTHAYPRQPKHLDDLRRHGVQKVDKSASPRYERRDYPVRWPKLMGPRTEILTRSVSTARTQMPQCGTTLPYLGFYCASGYSDSSKMATVV